MQTELLLYVTILVHALSAFAALGDPFRLRNYTPVDTDYYIKTLREDWTIDNYDKTHFADLENAEQGIPNHKKAKYSVAGVIDWTEVFKESTPVRKRAFWVGRGDPNVEPRDLLKVGGDLTVGEIKLMGDSALSRLEGGRMKTCGSTLGLNGLLRILVVVILCKWAG
jgi:hypothetical protein